MRFEAPEVSFTIIPHLRRLLPAIRGHDPKVHKQLRDASSSIPMNLAEGNRRRGKDRLFLWSVAAGSADEVHSGLRLASAWGYVPEGSVREALELLDRLQAMVWEPTGAHPSQLANASHSTPGLAPQSGYGADGSAPEPKRKFRM